MRGAIIALWALLIIGIVILLGPGRIVSSYAEITPQAIHAFIDSLGVTAEFAFIALSFIRPFLFLPVTPFTIASGYLFGFWYGLLLSFLGTAIAATVTFFLARYLFYDFVRVHLIGRHKILGRALDGGDWKLIMVVRMIPVLPFDLVGYVAGTSQLRFRDYLLGSILGEMPGAIVLVLFGTALNEIGSALFYGSLVLAILVTFAPEALRRIAQWRRERLARGP